MRAYDIIKKKRDGYELTENEIKYFVTEYVNGKIPDYQASALCMAIYFRGMTDRETAYLTFAIRDSGKKLDFSDIPGIKADKHSTGGVGDKTTLAVAPIVASLGIKVAKMSGRGLGHTGGTIDKLESFNGFNANLSTDEFKRVVSKTGLAIVGQSESLAPADKMLYALRDVTATVDSMPLIASSIMGKKLAADDDCIVLDVKTGNGAFMKSASESRELARLMVDIGRSAGKKIRALITDMSIPLGCAIGNSLEVIEAISVLKNQGPSDITEICEALSAHILSLSGYGDYSNCLLKVRDTIKNGCALNKLAEMVSAQGGNSSWVFDPSLFPCSAFSKEVRCPFDGFISEVDTSAYGTACMVLGAGRSRKEDIIDHSAGIVLKKKTGDKVKVDDVIAVLYTNRKEALEEAASIILSATRIADAPPKPSPLIIDVIE